MGHIQTRSGHVARGPEASENSDVQWRQSSVVQDLLARKHSLLVMLCLYERGNVSTTGLIRDLAVHPATVIAVLRDLERLGVLRRRRQTGGRHEIRAALTLKGMELVETPLYRWGRLVRDWSSTT